MDLPLQSFALDLQQLVSLLQSTHSLNCWQPRIGRSDADKDEHNPDHFVSGALALASISC